MQRGGNTHVEFDGRDDARLDKIPIRQHAAQILHHRINDGFDRVERGGDMRFLTGLLALILLLAGMGASQAVVRIGEDRGGRIGTYVDRFEDLRNSGESVIIDGLCASACTIVLGALPPERICVTSNANLGFHAAWDFGPNGRAVTNSEATEMLFSMYPSSIKRWIARRGGLTPHMIFLRGRSLREMYKPCYVDAEVAPARSWSRRDRVTRQRDVIRPEAGVLARQPD